MSFLVKGERESNVPRERYLCRALDNFSLLVQFVLSVSSEVSLLRRGLDSFFHAFPCSGGLDRERDRFDIRECCPNQLSRVEFVVSIKVSVGIDLSCIERRQ